MDIHQKVDVLEQAATLECEGAPIVGGSRSNQECWTPSETPSPREDQKARFINHSRVYITHPQRGKMPVMRIMQTSACERNCYYCPFRAGRNYRRVSLKPEDLATAFDRMQRRKLVDGLFLSSGIVGGGVKAMDPLLDTVDIVRRKYEYRGYIHLKIMPGAEAAQVERAARLADRLSINLEGANPERLARLAPRKNFWQELLPPLQWIHRRRRTLPPWVKAPSITTQFVVGPAGESDRELLATVGELYRQAGLARAYYSAFNPARDTPFEDLPGTPSLRQHRLYQGDWLLRFYGFEPDELPFDETGNLPRAVDPKLAWAKIHLSQFPLEVNLAGRAELLRIPGIGPKSAEAILAARRQGRLADMEQLGKLGAQVKRAAPFILLNGRRPDYQLPLI